VTAQPAPSASVPARVPASTIRALQLFLGHVWALNGTPRQRMAWVFQVHERTVMRWEERGALLSALPLESGARDPDWRRNLLIWLIDRYEKAGVIDNRKQGEGT